MVKDKVFMPIAIDVYNKKILIVGGGRVAYHKIQNIIGYCNQIHVVAREIDERIKILPKVSFEIKNYESSDLDDAFLVYACTNDHNTNLRIKQDALNKKILINVVDRPSECDFVSPAIYRKDSISIAVTSNGNDVYRSISVRNLIKNFFEKP